MTAQSDATFLVAGTAGEPAYPPPDPVQFVQGVVDAAEECPVIAVGGMTLERVHRIAATGAAGVAVLRGIWLDDAVAATRRYLAAYDEGLRR
jgi:thiamine monophosphate synthase